MLLFVLVRADRPPMTVAVVGPSNPGDGVSSWLMPYAELVAPTTAPTTAVPGGWSDATKLTAGEAGPVSPVGSVTVAVMLCLPSVNPLVGAQLHVPSSPAVAVQRAVPPSRTVTEPSGSDVPEIDEASLTVEPFFGVVIAGACGNSVKAGTAGPVTDTATLCTVILVPACSRKSPLACSRPPKYAPV